VAGGGCMGDLDRGCLLILLLRQHNCWARRGMAARFMLQHTCTAGSICSSISYDNTSA